MGYWKCKAVCPCLFAPFPYVVCSKHKKSLLGFYPLAFINKLRHVALILLSKFWTSQIFPHSKETTGKESSPHPVPAGHFRISFVTSLFPTHLFQPGHCNIRTVSLLNQFPKAMHMPLLTTNSNFCNFWLFLRSCITCSRLPSSVWLPTAAWFIS